MNTGIIDVSRAAQLSAEGDRDTLLNSLAHYAAIARNYTQAGISPPESLRHGIDVLRAAIECCGVFPEDDAAPAGAGTSCQSLAVPGNGVGAFPAVGGDDEEVVPVKVDPTVKTFVAYHFSRRNRAALYNEMQAARQAGADFDADYIMAALHVIRGGVWVDCVCGFTPEPGDAYCGGCGRSRGKYTMEKEVAHYDALGQTVEADWVAL